LLNSSEHTAGKKTDKEDKNQLTWKEAFFASPGPASVKKAGLLSLKGLCMGSADVIPGVSGGTIALITGIYEDLIGALKSIDATMVKKALQFNLKEALSGVHIRFLLCLFMGIGIAIISLARLMNFLLNHYPVFTWSLFFGLIAASILVVSRKVTSWSPRTGISLVVGTVVAAFIVNLMPVSTPEALWFVLLCGIIAICAMILPGISGAFILLILGKYEFITATLKNPFLAQNLAIIAVFCLGCLIGLLSFSRLLNFLLAHFRQNTMAFLTGLMVGSMPKIWPWKEILGTRIVGGKSHILWGANIMPETVSAEVLLALVLAITGFMAVLIIERLARVRESD
jgi:putative membrane protein